MLEKKVIKDKKNDQVKKEEPSIQSTKTGDRKTSNFSQVLARKILVSTVVASWKFFDYVTNTWLARKLCKFH